MFEFFNLLFFVLVVGLVCSPTNAMRGSNVRGLLTLFWINAMASVGLFFILTEWISYEYTSLSVQYAPLPLLTTLLLVLVFYVKLGLPPLMS